MLSQQLTVQNKRGLHARPSALLAKTANLYESSILLKDKGRTVDAKSILGLMTLALPQGSELTLCTDGPDEKEAMRHIADLFANRFGETD